MLSTRPALSLLALAIAAHSGSALADDGVLEISQTCAVTTGCFEGDSPGFPVTIGGRAPAKSFLLTSDLAVTSSTLPMVNIQTSRVTLDLGGFSIRNSVSSGSADVINANLLGGHAVIRNGTIRGGGGQGVDFSATGGTRVEDILFLNQGGGAVLLGDDSIVRRIRTTTSVAESGAGIEVGEHSEVSMNVVKASAGDGIIAGDGCTVSGNTVAENGGDGIDADSGSNVFENAVMDNGDVGIRVNANGRISANNVYSNDGDGIRASFSTLISDNVVASNQGDGIDAREAATVIGNSVVFNQGNGLDLLLSVYRNNNIQSPIPGVDVVGGIDGGGNICNGTTVCP
ncbi:MAG: right-handed parallel beta-helix repeat-containing protein [Myxococcota bacterium]